MKDCLKTLSCPSVYKIYNIRLVLTKKVHISVLNNKKWLHIINYDEYLKLYDICSSKMLVLKQTFLKIKVISYEEQYFI